MRRTLRYIVLVIAVAALVYAAMGIMMPPSIDRKWAPDQAVLARSVIVGDKAHITNIRNINYRSVSDYDIRYYDKTFDLSNIESLWYVVEPFKGQNPGAAHTLVSFGFEDGEYLAISAEIRKEEGEYFSALKGLMRQYEIMYVIADERDVIKLRSNYRKDEVFLYPIRMEKDAIRALFVSMLQRAEKLAAEPEYYNTLTNTCATNIVAHINALEPGRIPMSYKIVLPGHSDALFQEVGLIADSLPLDALRAKYRINERAEQYADDKQFSLRIREGIDSI